MTTFGSRSASTRAAAAALCVLLLVAALAASLVVGSNRMSAGTVWSALFEGLQSPEATVLRTQRLPRTLLGLLAGLALGAAGALMQGHTRNVLAEPGLFGVNAGAALGVVTATFALDRGTALDAFVAALIGAGGATIVIVAVAWGTSGRGTPVTLALVGSAVGGVLAAATTAIVLADRQSLETMRTWVVGSLTARSDDASVAVAVVVAAGLLLAVGQARGLTALGLGTDVARSLGNRVGAIRVVGIVAITLLAGAATAACGPIAFVGLVAPTLVRRFTGPSYGWIVPLAAILGAAVLLTTDTIGRVAVTTGELPVGVMLALVGAPVLIAVVSRRSMRL